MGQCVERCRRDSRDSPQTRDKNGKGVGGGAVSGGKLASQGGGAASPAERAPCPDRGVGTAPSRGVPSCKDPGEYPTTDTKDGAESVGIKVESGVLISALEEQEYSEQRIAEMFLRYRDAREDAVLADGMERFLADLHVEPADFVVLALAWKFQAATMCRFSREEFVGGCRALRADNTKAIQTRFPELMSEVQTEENFKELYRFTFNFGLDAEEGQRALPCEMAIALWRLVFSQDPPHILSRWLEFLSENPAGIRGVSRDTWNMFLNLAQTVGSDLSSYSEDEAWPSLFDAFVEWELERRRREESGGGTLPGGLDDGGGDDEGDDEKREDCVVGGKADPSGIGLQQG
ncbi:DCN1-like protein 3 [Lethenteron reissneri]|uniref:DCN1-like protein 3 n=1 Tax=Lethenteron reissneri TaxID=7753 RepID=UPI002AB6003B|nr:DCN1-like protein 3 [Lethenteron reissneri]